MRRRNVARRAARRHHAAHRLHRAAPRRKPVEVPAFGVHDRYGNTNPEGLKLR